MNSAPPYYLISIAISVISAVFGAGAAWGIASAKNARVSKDVNALGCIVRREGWNLMLGLMASTQNREDRELLARFLRK